MSVSETMQASTGRASIAYCMCGHLAGCHPNKGGSDQFCYIECDIGPSEDPEICKQFWFKGYQR